MPANDRPLFGTLVCLAHGPLEARYEQAAIGRVDAALSPEAEAALPRVVAELAAFNPEVVLSSDKRRNADVAARIAEAASVRHLVKRALRDQNFGTFEGRPWPEIAASEPEAAMTFLRSFASAAPPEGEALPDVSERVYRVLEVEIRRRSRRTIVWVADPSPIRCVLARVLDLPLAAVQRFKLDPFGVTVLRLQSNAGSLACLNHPVDGVPLHEKVW